MIKYRFTLQCVKLDRKATDKETGQHLWNLGLQLTGLEHEFVPYQTEKDEAGVEAEGITTGEGAGGDAPQEGTTGAVERPNAATAAANAAAQS